MSALDKIRSFAEARREDEKMLPAGAFSYRDMRELQAEVERLEAEVKRLKYTAEPAWVNLAKRAEQAEAEVKRLQKTDWQPIETAPKDGVGNWILIATSNRVTPAYWDCWAILDKPTWVTYSYRGERVAAEMDNPTHWMPLPAPPKAEK